MRAVRRFTKCDAVVLVICILFLCNLAVVGTSGRERAKRAICLANLRRLTNAWSLYADDNDGSIVNGDTGEYALHMGETPWVLRDWQYGMTVPEKQAAIADGALFPYTQDLRLYRCPLAEPSCTRSYAAVDAMNCKAWANMNAQMLKNTNEIDQPVARFVFIDSGNQMAVMGGWTCYVQDERWWDLPPIQHHNGANFSFADGHVEHWKWTDARTIEFGRQLQPQSPLQAGNEDIRRTQIAAWGTVSDAVVPGGGRRPQGRTHLAGIPAYGRDNHGNTEQIETNR